MNAAPPPRDWRDVVAASAKRVGLYGLLKECQWRIKAPADRGWVRTVSQRECKKLVNALPYQDMSVLEISGVDWADYRFNRYQKVSYPQFDICKDTLDDRFDLIIAEQVFEHLLWPYRAGRNICEMLNPGGRLLITTPFMYMFHSCPTDCSRWTERGMRHFLAECGFDFDNITTGSWGNAGVVRRAMRRKYAAYRFWWHSLRNDPRYPVQVWAMAQKPDVASGSGDAEPTQPIGGLRKAA